MAIFFTGWDLWQDMTFVLACCIVLVFVVGVVKLWWTNRTLRKHEIIEEERRTRLADMRHCGIDSLGTAEIPFGVRALENGVEVEGIWISRSNTPDHSQAASPALKGKEKRGDTASPHGSAPIDASFPTTATLDSSSSDAKGSTEAEPADPATRPQPYIPLSLYDGLYDGQRGTDECRSSCTPSPSGTQKHLLGLDLGPASSQHPHHVTGGDAALYGAARVYANRKTRSSKSGFDVLPAGVLGPRQELLPTPGPSADEWNADKETTQQEPRQPKQGPSKLRKKSHAMID